MNRYAAHARLIYPYGCAACGKDAQSHLMEWQEEVGLHFWIRPSLEHVKARMKHRRAVELRRRDDAWRAGAPMHPTYRSELADWARTRRQNRVNRRQLRLAMAQLRREEVVAWGRKNGKTSLRIVGGRK